MKANRLFTIALATVCGAAIMSVGSAFAAEGNETYYPQDFDRELTFETQLRDYAISGDTYAFANGTSVYIISNDDGERKLQKYPHSSEVLELDYDKDGKLFFKDIMKTTYVYSSAAPAVSEEDHVFQSLTTYNLVIDSNISYTLEKANGELSYWNDGVRSTVGTDFSLLKQYGDAIYAVKDNVPHKITESTAEALSLSYTDFNGAKNIYSGDTKTKLEKVSGSVETAQIKKDAYYTKINAEEIGEKFTPERTQKTAGNTPCLILCESGNASVVSIGGECYVTATENLTERAYCQSSADGKTYYAIEEIGVYTTPFMSGSTKITTLKSGAEHSVTVLEKYIHTVLSTEFCKISYKEGEETVTGYVAANFLTPYHFSAEDNTPKESDTKDFDYGTNVTTVVLVLLIVGLVIIAILYIVMVGFKRDKTGEKHNRKKRRPEPEDYDDDDEE